MAYTRRRWNPPRAGSRAREQMPRHAFLRPQTRTYPFKVQRGGRWVTSERGLMAAYRRAILQGRRDIARDALRRLNPIRRRQGKAPLPLR